MRIASFLPAATEMVYSLGLGDQLVGRTHECDFPPGALSKPVLVDCALDLRGMAMAEIDRVVTERLRSGKSLYAVDEKKLRQAAPELLITQNLCQVCGPSGNEVSQVLQTLSPKPEILWQTPRTFGEVLDAYQELGDKTGKSAQARAWVASAKERTRQIARKTAKFPRKVRISFVEWVDPVYCGGHWIPEMLSWAGGTDANSRDGTDSVRIDWKAVVDFAPEVVIVSPCGFKLIQAVEQAKMLAKHPGWRDLPAVKDGRVYAVDANSYFARPGPRLVDGVELLAHIIHTGEFAWTGPADAYRLL